MVSPQINEHILRKKCCKIVKKLTDFKSTIFQAIFFSMGLASVKASVLLNPLDL